MISGPKTDSSRFTALPGGDHPLGPMGSDTKMGSDTNKRVKDEGSAILNIALGSVIPTENTNPRNLHMLAYRDLTIPSTNRS
jgi:hypothetical protein